MLALHNISYQTSYLRRIGVLLGVALALPFATEAAEVWVCTAVCVTRQERPDSRPAFTVRAVSSNKEYAFSKMVGKCVGGKVVLNGDGRSQVEASIDKACHRDLTREEEDIRQSPGSEGSDKSPHSSSL